MISVVIPSYNSEKTIGKCLQALQKQSYRGVFEIVLVDSSTDGTPSMVSSRFPEVILIHLDKKTDPGSARNMGLERAKGDLIAFIDSDCIASADWLERIASAHDSAYRVVGGVILNGNPDGDLVAWAGYLAEFREFLPEQTKREVMHIPTCNISYKREVFREYGLFDGRYYPQEDLVYHYQLTRKGEKILLDPAIQVRHHHRSRRKDFFMHQRKIGEVTAKVLKTADLQGSFIARRPLLAAFSIPLLTMVKFLKTVLVFMRHEPAVLFSRPLALPLFAIGLSFWAAGFTRGTVRGNPPVS